LGGVWVQVQKRVWVQEREDDDENVISAVNWGWVQRDNDGIADVVVNHV
jgi:hypothetical protein